ncbi:MAG: NAD(P)-binding domain-containing protein [Sphingobium sp.]
MKISVLGTGAMGSAVTKALLKAGHDVTVYNRTRSKAERLAEFGARVAGNAAEAIQASSHSIILLFDEMSIRETLFTDETRAALSGKSLANSAFISSDECIGLARDVASAGGRLSDIQILTYPENMEAGEADYFLSCVPEDREQWHGIYQSIGRKVYDVGEVGNASKGQGALIMSYIFLTAATAFSVAGFQRQNLPVEVIRDLLGSSPDVSIGGAYRSIPEMANRQYGSGRFSIDNMAATIEAGMAIAAGMGLDPNALGGILQLYQKASAMGLGDRDVTAVYEVVNPRG